MARKDEERKRLAEVHQTDVGEGRINEDFVTWLKTKGPTWLLISLAFIVAYLWMVRWQQQEGRARDEAWIDLMSTVQPASLEDVAMRHAGIDSISDLARLTAADTLLRDIQRGSTIGDDGQQIITLDESGRDMHLNQAARLYQAIAAEDDGTTGRTLATVCALNGLAAVSECRGDVDEAAKQYRLAAARAEGWLTPLAAQATARAESTGELREEILFAIPASPPTPATNPVTLPKGLSLPPLNLPPAPQKPAAVPAEVPPASPAPGAPKPQ
ncbi:MAG: hypothetical protein P8I91_03870 [Phycisphaerales bacterium]|nr:hypothetical protein [Phycisphaerales bacterium]